MANGERKQDRRTLYTINTIKDSFLKWQIARNKLTIIM